MESRGYFLTEYDRDVLRDLHHSQHDKRLADRIKCIFCLDQGLTIEQSATLLLLSPRQVKRLSGYIWIKGLTD